MQDHRYLISSLELYGKSHQVESSRHPKTEYALNFYLKNELFLHLESVTFHPENVLLHLPLKRDL